MASSRHIHGAPLRHYFTNKVHHGDIASPVLYNMAVLRHVCGTNYKQRVTYTRRLNDQCRVTMIVVLMILFRVDYYNDEAYDNDIDVDNDYASDVDDDTVGSRFY